MPLVGFEPSSLLLLESQGETSTPLIPYENAVLFKYKLHNKKRDK